MHKTNEIELLVEATQALRIELTKYPVGGIRHGECYLRLVRLEGLLIRALLADRQAQRTNKAA